MKSKLAELERQHRSLSAQIRSCIDTAKRKGADHISEEFVAEGDRLAKERQEIELQMEKVKVEINYQESVVADKQVVANALLRFGEVVKSLPPEDQKDLIALMVRRISVNQCEPKTEAEGIEKRCVQHENTN